MKHETPHGTTKPFEQTPSKGMFESTGFMLFTDIGGIQITWDGGLKILTKKQRDAARRCYPNIEEVIEDHRRKHGA